jgi:hypothetical protein
MPVAKTKTPAPCGLWKVAISFGPVHILVALYSGDNAAPPSEARNAATRREAA